MKNNWEEIEKEFDKMNRKFWYKAEGISDFDYQAPKEYEAIKSFLKSEIEKAEKRGYDEGKTETYGGKTKKN